MWKKLSPPPRAALTVSALTALLSACSALQSPSSGSLATRANIEPEQLLSPEAASGYKEKAGWSHARYSVAAANPLATAAGYQMLRAGGSALDAAIAIQMVLTLVEPQSSGIGGGAFLLYFDGKDTLAYDGRETAPAAATPELFIGADGKPMPFMQGVVGGRSVGVPGVVRMLELAHAKHGTLPWASLFEPAIQLAEEGFAVSPRLHTLLAGEKELIKDPIAAAYFYDAQGKPWPVGHKLKNPELAKVLRAIAKDKSKALHEGPIAQAIVDKVRSHPSNPGVLSLRDMEKYQAKVREPFCNDYQAANQQNYRLCGMPPPSSGAIAIAQILGMVPAQSASRSLQDKLPTADWLHRYTEASRLAFADRAQFVADPDFVAAPGGDWKTLIAPAYLQSRAALIGEQSMKTAKPGNPVPNAKLSYAPMPTQTEYGTSHISVIDANGHALAMTTTIEAAFGSRQMVNGFLLNNELTDFSFAPSDAEGKPIANRVEPGKRPRSSMSPTLVFNKADNTLFMSAGSPGGALIIHYTAKTLYGVLNWGMSPQEAMNLPNFGSTNGPTLLEQQRFSPDTVKALQAKGHEVREMDMTSGLQAIVRLNNALQGGADPRREGVVMGE